MLLLVLSLSDRVYWLNKHENIVSNPINMEIFSVAVDAVAILEFDVSIKKKKIVEHPYDCK